MAAHVNVHRGVGLGELGGCGDALVAEGGGRRPVDHRPGHAGAVIL